MNTVGCSRVGEPPWRAQKPMKRKPVKNVTIMTSTPPAKTLERLHVRSQFGGMPPRMTR